MKAVSVTSAGLATMLSMPRAQALLILNQMFSVVFSAQGGGQGWQQFTKVKPQQGVQGLQAGLQEPGQLTTFRLEVWQGAFSTHL